MLKMGAKTSDPRILLVEALSRLKNEAIVLDRSGKIEEAIAKYISCTTQLQDAIKLPMPPHSENQRKLMEHLYKIVSRIAHPKGLRAGQMSAVPVEQHITKEEVLIEANVCRHERSTKIPTHHKSFRNNMIMSKLSSDRDIV